MTDDIHDTDVNESRGEDGGDDDDDGEDEIGPSDTMKELLRVLEFNAIDMYR